MGTEVGGCLGRSSPREPVEECVGLGTPLPCGEGSRNVAGGIGAGDKRAKVLPASRAFLSLPSSGEPGGGGGGEEELSGLALPGLPGTYSGEEEAESTSLFPASPNWWDRGLARCGRSGGDGEGRVPIP